MTGTAVFVAATRHSQEPRSSVQFFLTPMSDFFSLPYYQLSGVRPCRVRTGSLCCCGFIVANLFLILKFDIVIGDS